MILINTYIAGGLHRHRIFQGEEQTEQCKVSSSSHDKVVYIAENSNLLISTRFTFSKNTDYRAVPKTLSRFPCSLITLTLPGTSLYPLQNIPTFFSSLTPSSPVIYMPLPFYQMSTQPYRLSFLFRNLSILLSQNLNTCY